MLLQSSASSPDVETARGHGAVGNGGTSNGNLQLPPGECQLHGGVMLMCDGSSWCFQEI